MASSISILQSYQLSPYLFQVLHILPVSQGVFNFAACTLADITTHVNHVYAVSHVNLALVHVIQHFLGALGPDFVIAAVPEEADADDDVARKGQPFLRLQELFLEPRAAAKCYNRVFTNHSENLSLAEPIYCRNDFDGVAVHINRLRRIKCNQRQLITLELFGAGK